MTESVSRAVVEAFYEAYGARDFQRLAGFIADDVEWITSGPVDLLRFCGVHRGKAAVRDMFERQIPQVFDLIKFEPTSVLVDGDRAAGLSRLWARRKDDGRVISYRLAHFMRFRNDKVVENLALLDSFDAVEQVLGHSLAMDERAPADDDLIAV